LARSFLNAVKHFGSQTVPLAALLEAKFLPTIEVFVWEYAHVCIIGIKIL